MKRVSFIVAGPVGLVSLVMTIAGVAYPSEAFAVEPYRIDWYTMDGGGGTSTGGPHKLSGTIGQADAASSSSDIYELLGGFWVGGLVGSNGNGTVTQCYGAGAANGNSGVARLVWANFGSVIECYSAGAVSGEGSVGGLVGRTGGGSTPAKLWDIETSGRTTSAGGTGKTTAEMQMAQTFLDAGWDFMGETVNGTEDIWWINEGKDYPRLWWEPIPEN